MLAHRILRVVVIALGNCVASAAELANNTWIAAFLCLMSLTAAHADSSSECERLVDPHVGTVKDDLSTGALPAPDYRDRVHKCNVQRLGPSEPTPSSWLEAERAAYLAAFDKTGSHTLVAPFQVQGYALDRIERALMTLDLSYEVGASSAVADPTLVARALGEGSRRIDSDSILKLARRLKAHEILIPFVGHDSNHAMTITIQVLDLDSGGAVSRTTQRDWRMIPFSDESPPFLTFHKILHQILVDLALPAKRASSGTRASARPSARMFPSSPAELFADPTVSASVTLSVLGALASPTSEMARERLFERALIASLRFDPDLPDTTFRQAYALMCLSHRPAALALLDGASSPAAVTLRSLLNGDLPGVREALKGVTGPLERLLLEIGLEDLRQEYADPTPADRGAAVAFFGPQSTYWLALANDRFRDADSWGVDAAEEIKTLLDDAFPVAGLELEAVEAGEELLRTTHNASLDVVLDVASGRHVRKVATELGPASCCDHGPPRASQWDLLWLLEGRADARILRRVRMVSGHQGNTKRALSILDDYEPFFSGHPGLAAERGLAAYALALSEPDDLRASRVSEIQRDGLLVAETSTGESQVTFRGIGALGDVNKDAARLFWNVYGFDFPRRSFWPVLLPLKENISDPPSYEASARESLLYSTMDLDPIADVPQRTDAEKLALTGDLTGRFVGAPGWSGILALLRPSSAPALDPIEELRKEISLEPNTWLNYYNLGLALIQRDDDYAAAAKLFLSYPQFHEPNPPDRVALSDEAYQGGSYLYLHGHAELSEPLYRVSADLNTGSEAGMASASRLLLQNGDFDGFLTASAGRATHYPNAYVYRDYLSMLHAMGRGDEVWPRFPQLSTAFELPLVWISAMVGHRIEGRSEVYVRDWLKRPEIRGARLHAEQFAPLFAVMWNVTDRMPPSDFGDLVASLTDDTEPRSSDLVRFAVAYAELRRKHWEKAADDFPTGIRGPLYAEPYQAMAVAKMGDPNGIAKRYDRYDPAHLSAVAFDSWLARAVFAAARHDSATALESLRWAFIVRPNTDARPIQTEYEYAEVCEWLYRETHDKRFVERLLQWTESYEKVQPTQAWSYALEYTYLPPGDLRKRALAMTLYLDQKSPRIARATPAQVRGARAWLADNNPFLIHAKSGITASSRSPNVRMGTLRNYDKAGADTGVIAGHQR